jgi:hypothetical protein
MYKHKDISFSDQKPQSDDSLNNSCQLYKVLRKTVLLHCMKYKYEVGSNHKLLESVPVVKS